jgi:hypothetical protein
MHGRKSLQLVLVLVLRKYGELQTSTQLGTRVLWS